MPSSLKLAALAAIAIFLALGSPFAGSGALAQSAPAPDQRCTGTFCDFYYSATGRSGAAAAQPATQAAVPDQRCTGTFCDFYYSATGRSAPAAWQSQPANQAAAAGPSKPSDLAPPDGATPGGGVMGLMKGNASERCSGTFCDLYYGSAGPPEPRNDAPESAAERNVRQSRAAEFAERPERQRCAAPPNDPWRCYR